MKRQHRHRAGPATRLVVVAAALLLVGGPLGAEAGAVDSATEAETLVRHTWYEGLPPEAARALQPGGVARLLEMLADPDEAPHHGNIALALGYSGHPEAFGALSDFARSPLVGEVDRAAFRARTHAVLAMGHLARSDGRALRWLLDAYDAPAAPPAWHFRHHRGTALRALLEEQVLTALALSGAPAARARIDREVEQAHGSDPASRRRLRHAQAARALLDAGPPPHATAGPPR